MISQTRIESARESVTSPKGNVIEILGAREIFAPIPPISSVVEGLDMCVGAPTLLAARGYLGKSLAAQAMAIQVAAGEHVWERFRSSPGGVVLLDWEQGRNLTCERFQRIGRAHEIDQTAVEGRLCLVSMPGFHLDEAGAEDVLGEICGGRSLAIFDSFRAACPSTDENSSAARLPLDMLTRVSLRTGCVMFVVHHARKFGRSKSTTLQDVIRGSSALFDACGSVLVFERGQSDDSLRVSHLKARVSGRVQAPFELRFEDYPKEPNTALQGLRVEASLALEEDDCDSSSTRAGTIHDEVLQLMQHVDVVKGGPDTIAKAIHRKAANVRPVVKAMIQTGEILPARTADGKRGYRLLPEARTEMRICSTSASVPR